MILSCCVVQPGPSFRQRRPSRPQTAFSRRMPRRCAAPLQMSSPGGPVGLAYLLGLQPTPDRPRRAGSARTYPGARGEFGSTVSRGLRMGGDLACLRTPVGRNFFIAWLLRRAGVPRRLTWDHPRRSRVRRHPGVDLAPRSAICHELRLLEPEDQLNRLRRVSRSRSWMRTGYVETAYFAEGPNVARHFPAGDGSRPGNILLPIADA